MIEWKRRAEGADGLAIYKIEAEAEPFTGGGFSPLDVLLERFPSPTGRLVRERFASNAPPAARSSFRVACHAVSLPDALVVVDSTFRSTGPEVFPGVLDAIAASEGRRLDDRPLLLVYTHAHFDHAGGHAAVAALGDAVTTYAHPYTVKIHSLMAERRGFTGARGHFFRDLELGAGETELDETLAEAFRERQAAGAPAPPEDEPPLRADVQLDPGGGRAALAGGRVELLRFDGHFPGHLCVLVDGAHLVSGDMWLPETTSTITPRRLAAQAAVPDEHCGVARYIASSARLLRLPVDECASYPSHEHVFRNPKRMALRDLELFAERFERVYAVLAAFRHRPMRVLDLAWGGADGRPIWSLRGSKYRLMAAHDEATAYAEDLAELGDLREVEPERYLYTGGTALRERLHEALAAARADYGHLEFRSRGRDPDAEPA